MRKFISKLLNPVSNWAWFYLYESAQKWGSSQRGFIESPEPRDIRYDITKEVRLEIVRKSRKYEANDAFCNRLADVYEQFVIGANGLKIEPDSSDLEWNQRAKEYWNESSKLLDISSRLTTASLQTIGARREFFDGYQLILKTRGSGLDNVARPRIQMVECHRVGTPPELTEQEGKTIIDGWSIDPRGRATGVYIQDHDFSTDEDKYRFHPIEKVILLGEPARSGQYHPLPFLHAVFNDLQDLRELQGAALAKAKDLANITRILETSGGEFDLSKLKRERVTESTKNASNEDSIQTKTKWIQSIFGPRAIAIKTGDKLTEMVNGSPSVSDQVLWNMLTSRVCIGTGVQKIFVFPESITQGTSIRGEYELGNAFFKSRFQVHAAAWTEVYHYVMDWGIKNDARLKGAPKDWKRVSVVPPRAANVDVGRNSSAMLAELAAGATNYDLIYAPLGLDAYTEIEKGIKFAKYIQDKCREAGISPESFSANIVDLAMKMREQEALRAMAAGGGEDDDEA